MTQTLIKTNLLISRLVLLTTCLVCLLPYILAKPYYLRTEYCCFKYIKQFINSVPVNVLSQCLSAEIYIGTGGLSLVC